LNSRQCQKSKAINSYHIDFNGRKEGDDNPKKRIKNRKGSGRPRNNINLPEQTNL